MIRNLMGENILIIHQKSAQRRARNALGDERVDKFLPIIGHAEDAANRVER